MARFALVFLFALVGCDEGAGSSADLASPDLLAPVCGERATKLQAAIDDARNSEAAVVAVATADCPTLTVVSGDATPESLFRVGSITKTYVAATIVALEAEGKLHFDDTLEDWSLEVPNAAAITITHLLQHTSGIFNYTQDKNFVAMAHAGESVTPDALVALATAHPPLFAPGSSWSYSNTNYILLGMIIEAATKTGIAEAVRSRAFAPGHLSHTAFDGEEPWDGVLAPGFDALGIDVTNFASPSWAWAAGAVVATAGDTADWAHALYGGEVLSTTGRAALSATPVATGQPGLRYGFGTMILSDATTGGLGAGLGHGGDIFGYHSFVVYLPERGTSIAAIVNSDAASPNDLLLAALDTLFPR